MRFLHSLDLVIINLYVENIGHGVSTSAAYRCMDVCLLLNKLKRNSLRWNDIKYNHVKHKDGVHHITMVINICYSILGCLFENSSRSLSPKAKSTNFMPRC